MSMVSNLLRASTATFPRRALHDFRSKRCMSSVIDLSDDSAVTKFKSINEKSILYFTATWCPPCKMIKPVYENMAKENPDVAFGKVDVDDNAESAAKYKISGVPTFVFFSKDDTVARFTGADQAQLEKLIGDLKDSP
uniref:Thioredoxin domain-containing protein n=1 Tax=Corethron hystrix TaxID=216773 RepID=A0A7S1C0K1_9STRA|mmetsp:Transcript_6835/g.14747  ORF Transcript_6835/g.14747 Transcript_6835/m.14747 type:complete len:137 (+) Transcript_6835:92-502(+)|eukprot:CAMPEP_0113300606 /NCGR_PEP_ID=MMETSP0010_2-20120614/2165_1 /TAXON_ID=216773 ORGANISM="Corethron hystrix, Strain 308" /NCGR_SAMPLE_ID=MMETSP0010_2 /ASSEMBLY_ACC=CAM_ASM_000155 /LENGTH=136 /DNA_ID=CAMNT_0000154057 /DNA_START=72 /DNA_END=482 /DNA_ORIENTATION=- /assembly_acc=CAM_ASM_000155